MDKILSVLALIILSVSVAPAWAQPYTYSALQFGVGSGENVSITSTATINVIETTTFTMAAWIRPTTLSLGREIFGKNAGAGNQGPRFRLDSTTLGELGCLLAKTTTSASAVTNTVALAVNNWYFVVCIYDPNDSQPRIYVGTLTKPATEAGYAAGATIGSGTVGGGDALVIGNTSAATKDAVFQGRISTASMWQRKLNLQEIRDQQRCPRVAPGNHGLLLFLGSFGNATQIDLTGSGNNGTASGTTFNISGHPEGPPFCPSFPPGVGT